MVDRTAQVRLSLSLSLTPQQQAGKLVSLIEKAAVHG